ncbi:hypothetical protein [Bradyrhizobium elkanii]|uniref:hypothetical protein n=1 Tax=Bradyrhizobium elkanii TaxID=29448 RepID=UPI002169ADE6|nr:hypothetical protein [Bradyrhizobium elkanii]MCS3690883.1 hypothetical protein [Bradyrhizobium elkanii]
MSQRDSGYERKERDLYETPEWVTLALAPHLYEATFQVWEPACGSGKMVRALEKLGLTVFGSDIETGNDFFDRSCDPTEFDAIITNPPYVAASEFIVHALDQNVTTVAMLLRTDFDHAKSRQHLFQDSRFAKKVVLTRRIKWFEDSKGQPSFNHAWFIWESGHVGPPTLAYGPAHVGDAPKP